MEPCHGSRAALFMGRADRFEARASEDLGPARDHATVGPAMLRAVIAEGASMSSGDNLPPSADTPTLPAPPPDPPSASELPPIPQGRAQEALRVALDDLSRTLRIVEAVGMACARQLDAEVRR
jgi:hypothetical protein